jgi:multiple sugar transport system permease protein
MASISPPLRSLSPVSARHLRRGVNRVGVTGLALFTLFLFLLPMGYGIVTSLKTDAQISKAGSPWWPANEYTYEYQGKPYEIYLLPMEDGTIRQMALVVKGRESASFVDPDNPEAGLFEWQGRWRTLDRAWAFDAQWSNFVKAWNTIRFPRLLRNTLMYAFLSTFGAVTSASVVAYGFARFRFPRKNVLFMIVLGTIILPPAVTLIPTYAVYHRIGWIGTWLPLIVPAFFANGYNIFLLRQFFLNLPRELDEAATIDGAGPLRIFWSIILPQSIPALTAVTLFHFFFCWNDYFGPLIYLAGNPELYPITVGLTAFNKLYTQQTNLIQASALIASALPLFIFFMAQRVFMQGVVITGVDK